METGWTTLFRERMVKPFDVSLVPLEYGAVEVVGSLHVLPAKMTGFTTLVQSMKRVPHKNRSFYSRRKNYASEQRTSTSWTNKKKRQRRDPSAPRRTQAPQRRIRGGLRPPPHLLGGGGARPKALKTSLEKLLRKLGTESKSTTTGSE